jgi:hypothetical protein
MKTIPLFDQESNQRCREKDPLAAFRKEPEQITEIQEWMTAKEAAQFMTDRLIAMIREQMDAAGKKFEEREK